MWSETLHAGQAVTLVVNVFVDGSSGPDFDEDSGCVVCSSCGFVYGALLYLIVNVCGGMVDGSG